LIPIKPLQAQRRDFGPEHEETAMQSDLRQKILQLLDEHRIMSLATLRPDGWPQVTTVGYVSEGLVLFFLCGRDSQKARNLAADNRVSLTIDHDVGDPMAISGLSMAARAFPVTSEAEIRDAILTKLPKKYPEYSGMMPDLDLAQIAVFRVVPEVISVLDYSRGFGHADLVSLEPADREAA
jgi:nitroimidazol reductase NimA-like FMN-containing flavoprotein (pyridoxamine 5'-phosphate oxidase superfamily)